MQTKFQDWEMHEKLNSFHSWKEGQHLFQKYVPSPVSNLGVQLVCTECSDLWGPPTAARSTASSEDLDKWKTLCS